MASQKLLEMLNKGVARELQVSIQYMWQHILVTGINGAVVEDTFKRIAITEMKHAEEAVQLYGQAIQVANEEGDYTTRRLLEDILSDEEKHLNKFSKLLVGMTSP